MRHLLNRLNIILAAIRLALRVPLDTDLERANYRYSVIEGCLATITIQVVATFTPVYALALGATNHQVGLFYSLPFLFNIVALLIANRFIHAQGGLMRIGQGTAYLHRVIILLFIAAPILGTFSVWWIVLLFSLASAALAVSAVFWQGISSDMFPESQRGIVFGTRAMYTGTIGLLAVMAAGKVLDLVRYPLNFAAVFISVAFVGFAAAYYYGRLVPPEEGDTPNHATEVAVRPSRLNPISFVRTVNGKRFLSLTLTVALFNVGFHMSAPIGTIYYVDHLGLTNAVIGILTAVVVMFQVVGSRTWGHISDRWGTGAVLFVTTGLLGIQAVVFAAVPSVLYLVLMQAIGGFALGGYNLATLNALFVMGDRRHRPQLILWYNVVVGMAAFIGPQIGTLLLSQIMIAWVFVISGGARLLATLLMVRMARGDMIATQARRTTLRRSRRRTPRALGG